MVYDPQKYWKERGKHYAVSDDTTKETNNLKNLLTEQTTINLKEDKILEHGSGYGRIYMALKQNLGQNNYYMCDISETMIQNCHTRTRRIPHLLTDTKKLSYFKNDSFDFLISFSVLLHVQPCDIKSIIKEYKRVVTKNGYIFIATYFGGLKRLAEHCFEHDYYKLFTDNNLLILDTKFFLDGLRVNWLLLKEGDANENIILSKKTTINL